MLEIRIAVYRIGTRYAFKSPTCAEVIGTGRFREGVGLLPSQDDQVSRSFGGLFNGWGSSDTGD